MSEISVLPLPNRPSMTPLEQQWAVFFDLAQVDYQYKPLVITENSPGVTENTHSPSFLLQMRFGHPKWFEVLPALNTRVLPHYDKALHFARTIYMVDEKQRSEYWSMSPDCVFVAFGSPGLPQGRYSGTFAIFVIGTDNNPEPVIGDQATSYAWAECSFCHRLTICWDFGDDLGDVSGSVRMSCCGGVIDGKDPRTRPIRNSDRLQRAILAASRRSSR